MRILNIKGVRLVFSGLMMLLFLAVILPFHEVKADAANTPSSSQQQRSSPAKDTASAQTSGTTAGQNTGTSGSTEKETASSATSPYVSPDVITENTAGKPFSIEGNGNLVDDAYDDDTKEFITVQTKNNQTFFVVIDRANTLNNVYMLSLIDEDDLQQFLSDDTELTQIDDISDLAALEEEQSEPEQAEQSKGSGGMMYIFLIITGAGVLIGYYYIRIYKPRKEEQEADSEDMEGNGSEEDYDDGEYGDDADEEQDYSDY